MGRGPHVTVLRWGAAAIATLIALHGLNKVLLGDGRFLSVDQEQNLPTWARVVLFAGAAAACLLVARHGERDRGLWLAFGIVLALMSLDDAAMIHEWLEEQADFRVALLGWQLGIAGAVLVSFALAYRRFEAPQRLLVMLAAFALVAAQGASTITGVGDPPHAMVVALSLLEQASEAAFGVVLLAAAAAPAQRALRRAVAVEPLSPPRQPSQTDSTRAKSATSPFS